ncbi:hypothetical protein J6590_001635 [Homalodisca vitripennis]|nr:hypothetical protein J6590_001635 [Homalodisca vitripennis]
MSVLCYIRTLQRLTAGGQNVGACYSDVMCREARFTSAITSAPNDRYCFCFIPTISFYTVFRLYTRPEISLHKPLEQGGGGVAVAGGADVDYPSPSNPIKQLNSRSGKNKQYGVQFLSLPGLGVQPRAILCQPRSALGEHHLFLTCDYMAIALSKEAATGEEEEVMTHTTEWRERR